MAPRDQVELSNFYMDLENWVLEHRWDHRLGIPCGPLRLGAPCDPLRNVDSLWGLVMRTELLDYPRHPWSEYSDWVLGGGGDDWFQPPDSPQNACSSRESAMPLPAAANHATVNGYSSIAENLRRVGQAGG